MFRKDKWKGAETYHKLHLKVFPMLSRRRARRRKLASEVSLGAGTLNRLRRTISQTVADTNKVSEELNSIRNSAEHTTRTASNALKSLDRILSEFKGDADVFMYFRNPPSKDQMEALTRTLLEINPTTQEVEAIKFIEQDSRTKFSRECMAVVRLPITVNEDFLCNISRNLNYIVNYVPRMRMDYNSFEENL